MLVVLFYNLAQLELCLADKLITFFNPPNKEVVGVLDEVLHPRHPPGGLDYLGHYLEQVKAKHLLDIVNEADTMVVLADVYDQQLLLLVGGQTEREELQHYVPYSCIDQLLQLIAHEDVDGVEELAHLGNGLPLQLLLDDASNEAHPVLTEVGEGLVQLVYIPLDVVQNAIRTVLALLTSLK